MRLFHPRSWLPDAQRQLEIDEGRVGCPAHGDADLEWCFACGYLITIEGDHHAQVVCAYPGEGEPLA